MINVELGPQGLTVVTVALDASVADARRWVERAAPSHPSLVDPEHLLAAQYGVVNVPNGIWIDEDGRVVRPPEPAFPARPPFLDRDAPEGSPQALVDRLREARKIRVEPDKYVAALRDWVAHGAASRYALPEEEVVGRSRGRPQGEGLAGAHFELGQHLWRGGHLDDAAAHFREAHRLHPENWTYKRQAWHLNDPAQGPSERYESDWLTEARAIGAESYYPRLDL